MSREEWTGFLMILTIVFGAIAVSVVAAHELAPDAPWETGIGCGLALGILLLTCLA